MKEILAAIKTTKCDFNDKVVVDFKRVIEAWRYTVKDVVYHVFPNNAYTLCFVLSESHCIIHTYPEKSLIYLNLFTGVVENLSIVDR